MALLWLGRGGEEHAGGCHRGLVAGPTRLELATFPRSARDVLTN